MNVFILRKQKPLQWKQIAKALILSLLLLFIFTKWIIPRLFPLEWASLRSEISFKRAGILNKKDRITGIHWYERLGCQDNTDKAAQKNCPCLVLIHGMGDQALTWKRLLLSSEPLKARLIALDLPGFGDSKPALAVEDYQAQRLGQKLIDFFNQPELLSCSSGIYLAGNSFGGWVSIWSALKWDTHLPRLKALILIGASGIKNSRDPHLIELMLHPSVENLKEFQHRAYFDPKPLPDYVWRAVAEKTKNADPYKRLAVQLPEDELTREKVLPLNKIPVWLVWGSHDGVVSPSWGRTYHSWILSSHYRELSRCGHLPQKECPEQLMNVFQEILQSP